MQKEAGILYKVLNCSKFLAFARLLCSKAAVRGAVESVYFATSRGTVANSDDFLRLLTFRTSCPLVFKREAACVTLHEMLVSAGPVVLYAYVLCNKFYHSCRNSNPSYFMDANGDLGGCGSLMTSLLAR